MKYFPRSLSLEDRAQANSKAGSWAGRVDQVVDHLPSKYGVLSSNPSATEKNQLKLALSFSTREGFGE